MNVVYRNIRRPHAAHISGLRGPHLNLNGHMPNDGDLVGYIPRIAPTRELQHKLLIDKLLRLYWTH